MYSVRACRESTLAKIGLLCGVLLSNLGSFTVAGASVSLAWNPSLSTKVVGYNVYYGVASHRYTFSMLSGTNTAVTVGGLAEGQTYYFTTAAYDYAGAESPLSNEVTNFIPISTNAPVAPISLTPPSFPGVPTSPTAPTAPTPPIPPTAPTAPAPPSLPITPNLPVALISSMKLIRSGAQLSQKLSLSTTAVMGPDVSAAAPDAVPAQATAAGVYNGLFYQIDAAGMAVMTAATTGFVRNCVLNSNGYYSARLAFAERSYAFAGKFNESGDTTAVISRLDAGLPSLSVALHLDPSSGTGQLTGVVSNIGEANSWVAQLNASKAANASIPAVKFLFLSIPPLLQFGGASNNGWCELTVDSSGMVSLFGRLGDGAIISQTAPISGDGSFPIYVSLNQRAGGLAGWLNPGASSGRLLWIRSADAQPLSLNQESFSHVIRYVTAPDWSATNSRLSQ